MKEIKKYQPPKVLRDFDLVLCKKLFKQMIKEMKFTVKKPESEVKGCTIKIKGNEDTQITFYFHGLYDERYVGFIRNIPKQDIQNLYTEIDCRIEHGAKSNGHLEFVRDQLSLILGRKDNG